MKRNEKIATGVAAGALLALLAIPKTRKVIMNAAGSVACSLKNMVKKAEEHMPANA